MDETSKTALQDKIEVLSVQFRERCVSEANVIAGLVDGFLDNPMDRSPLSTARGMVHRMAGGAAIFGLGTLTAPALALENAIDAQGDTAEIAAACDCLVNAIFDAVGTDASIARERPQRAVR